MRWTPDQQRTTPQVRHAALHPGNEGWLSVGAANHIHEFGDLAALIGLVAGGDRMLDAVGDVVAQDFLLDPAQRGFCRRDLRHHVDAIAVVRDHPGETADLALNSLQPFQAGRLDLVAHMPIYPPRVYNSRGRRGGWRK